MHTHVNSRPLLVTLYTFISIIYYTIGFFGIGSALMMVIFTEESLKFSAFANTAGLLLLIGCGIIGNIGVWFGKKWGWLMTQVCLAYFLLLPIRAVLLGHEIPSFAMTNAIDIAKFVLQVFFKLLIMWYFCRPLVGQFFELSQEQLRRLLWSAVAIGISIHAIGMLLILIFD